MEAKCNPHGGTRAPNHKYAIQPKMLSTISKGGNNMSKMMKVVCALSVMIMVTLMYSVPAKAYSDPTLYPWSTGQSVRVLQQLLNQVNNAHLAVDGIYGPKTRGAVRDFQARYRLSCDGICGPQTWGKLRALTSRPQEGSQVKTMTHCGSTFIVPASFDAKYVYKQTTNKNCTKFAADIAISIATNQIYKNTGWTNGGCTWVDKDGKTKYLWWGYDKTNAQVKMNKAAEIMRKTGLPTILRMGGDYGHSVTVVGVRKGANESRITNADLLIADPADGKVKTLEQMKQSGCSWYHGGVVSYDGKESNRWSIGVPFPMGCTDSITSGFHR